MPRVIPQRHRRSIGTPDASMRAQDQDFLPAHLGRVPPHARVLAPREHVAGRAVQKHLRRDRKLPLRPGRFRLHREEGGVGGIYKFKEGRHSLERL